MHFLIHDFDIHAILIDSRGKNTPLVDIVLSKKKHKSQFDPLSDNGPPRVALAPWVALAPVNDVIANTLLAWSKTAKCITVDKNDSKNILSQGRNDITYQENIKHKIWLDMYVVYYNIILIFLRIQLT